MIKNSSGNCAACDGKGWVWGYLGGRIQIACPSCGGIQPVPPVNPIPKCPCCGRPGGDGLPCESCSDEDGAHLGSAEQIIRLAREHGFEPMECGGGCWALRRELGGGFYALITQQSDPSLPETSTEPVTLGLYREEGDDAVELVSAANISLAFEKSDEWVNGGGR